MRTLYKIIIVLAILFVSFEIGIAIPGSFIYALITLIIIAGIIYYIISIYNDLVTKRNRVKNSWSKIDVQLKRRTDLIPNLVEVVKGYAKHESQVLEDIVKLRNLSYDKMSLSDKIETNQKLSGELSKIMAVAESYPDLKASQNYSNLIN